MSNNLNILVNDETELYFSSIDPIIDVNETSITISEGDKLHVPDYTNINIIENNTINQTTRADISNSEYKSFTSGDPHVYPVFGKSYELYDQPYIYRMLQGKSLFVNASTRYITSNEREDINRFYRTVTHKEAPKSLQTCGVFYNEVYISSEDNVCTIQFNYDTIEINNENRDYYRIFENKSNEIKTIEKDLIKSEHIIQFDHKIYGTINLSIRTFLNPQIKYGFSFKCEDINDLTGLMVREYALKSMRIKNIKSRKLLNGTRKLNRKYTRQATYKLSY